MPQCTVKSSLSFIILILHRVSVEGGEGPSFPGNKTPVMYIAQLCMIESSSFSEQK